MCFKRTESQSSNPFKTMYITLPIYNPFSTKTRQKIPGMKKKEKKDKKSKKKRQQGDERQNDQSRSLSFRRLTRLLHETPCLLASTNTSSEMYLRKRCLPSCIA